MRKFGTELQKHVLFVSFCTKLSMSAEVQADHGVILLELLDEAGILSCHTRSNQIDSCVYLLRVHVS